MIARNASTPASPTMSLRRPRTISTGEVIFREALPSRAISYSSIAAPGRSRAGSQCLHSSTWLSHEEYVGVKCR
jgi:hypothetical protein